MSAAKYEKKNDGSMTSRTERKEPTDEEKEALAELQKKMEKRLKFGVCGIYTVLALFAMGLNTMVALLDVWGFSFVVNFVVMPLLGYSPRRIMRKLSKRDKYKLPDPAVVKIKNYTWSLHLCLALYCVVLGFPIAVSLGQLNVSRQLQMNWGVVDGVKKVVVPRVNCPAEHISCEDWNNKVDFVDWLHWEPDLNQIVTTSYRRHGLDLIETYCVAPLVYTGPASGRCQTSYPAFAACLEKTLTGETCTNEGLKACGLLPSADAIPTSTTTRVVAGRYVFYEPHHDSRTKQGFSDAIDKYYQNGNAKRPNTNGSTANGECARKALLVEWDPPRGPSFYRERTEQVIQTLSLQCAGCVVVWSLLLGVVFVAWEKQKQIKKMYDFVCEKIFKPIMNFVKTCIWEAFLKRFIVTPLEPPFTKARKGARKGWRKIKVKLRRKPNGPVTPTKK